jgi:hypothetical protein
MKALQERHYARIFLTAGTLWLVPLGLYAQGGQGAGGAASGTAKAIALADFTGQWVSVITEDWRFRMITPAAGDYASVPLSPEGRKVADSWSPAKDEAAGEQCRAYGAAGVMREPTRIRISWPDDETLKVETDTGTQTRMFYFKDPKTQGGDWQGLSQASWILGPARGPVPGGGNEGGENRRQAAGPGTLKVVTTKMKAGYLRKNGVPYSDKTVLTEYYDRIMEPNGDSWLVVETIVDDPVYLNQPFLTSTHFRKQNDQSGWNPTACSAR